MRNLILAGVGIPGATLLGLAAWVVTVSHDTPSNARHRAQLLYGVDEYWNGEYPKANGNGEAAEVSCSMAAHG